MVHNDSFFYFPAREEINHHYKDNQYSYTVSRSGAGCFLFLKIASCWSTLLLLLAVGWFGMNCTLYYLSNVIFHQ